MLKWVVVLDVRRVIGHRVAVWLCRSPRALTLTQHAIGVIPPEHNPAGVIFLPAAHVISWADILGRRSSRKHSALALVMQSIRKKLATNAIRFEQECRSDDRSARPSR